MYLGATSVGNPRAAAMAQAAAFRRSQPENIRALLDEGYGYWQARSIATGEQVRRPETTPSAAARAAAQRLKTYSDLIADKGDDASPAARVSARLARPRLVLPVAGARLRSVGRPPRRARGLGAVSVDVDPTAAPPWYAGVVEQALAIFQAERLRAENLRRLREGLPPLSAAEARALAPTANVNVTLPPGLTIGAALVGAAILAAVVARPRRINRRGR